MLESTQLTQFRNYDTLSCTFAPGVNGIFGPNGSGKTNLLEAITLLSTGRSFRGASLEEMTQHDEGHFRVAGTIKHESIPTQIALSAESGQKRATINATSYSYYSAVLGIFPSVLFAPSDMRLITGAPAERRRFWNILLAQGSPLYLHHLTRYTRALKQRNTLLKRKETALLDPWEAQLAQSGTELIRARRTCVEALRPFIQQYHHQLSPDAAPVSLVYLPSLDAESTASYQASLQRSLTKDLLYQSTNIGPHRDDFALHLDGRLAKTYASEGQKRTCIAALKCAEWELLRTESIHPPLFCIDDCPAHLDEERTARFIAAFSAFPQVIMTAPSSSVFPTSLFSSTLETVELLGSS